MSAKWTKEEDAFLAEGYKARTPIQEMANRLGRTRGGVQMRAIKLGLRTLAERGDRSARWIAIQELCRDGIGRTADELAEAIGAGRRQVETLMHARRNVGKAHVVDYRSSQSGPRKPIWLPVPGVDAVRPGPLREGVKQKRRCARQPDSTAVRREAAPIQIPDQHEIIRALFGMGASA